MEKNLLNSIKHRQLTFEYLTILCSRTSQFILNDLTYSTKLENFKPTSFKNKKNNFFLNDIFLVDSEFDIFSKDSLQSLIYLTSTHSSSTNNFLFYSPLNSYSSR